jgi:hypothetical protein
MKHLRAAVVAVASAAAASWRVLYKDGGEWKPVEAAGAYETGKDRYSRVAFKPVATSALRLEVTLPPQWSAGILEWKIE